VRSDGLLASAEHDLLARARTGDRDAFAQLVEPYRRGIHIHCYRMLGSLHDAEDLLQETLLRGWRRLDRFEGRSSLRAWLYQIATNACLDALKRGKHRLLPDSYAPPGDPTTTPASGRHDIPWIEPYPDRLLEVADGEDPARRYEARELIELTFITAIQCLSPRQRAVLIMRDALGFSARETAAMLEMSFAAVNSALQRAHAAVAGQSVQGAREARDVARLAEEEASLVERYVRAWEAADVDGLVALLREDARMTMPPTPSWYLGRDAIGAFLTTFFAGELGHRSRLAPTRANRQPALAVYTRDADLRYQPLALMVLTIEEREIAAITGFTEPTLFSIFVLPQAPDGTSAAQQPVAHTPHVQHVGPSARGAELSPQA
jgi:RNA polymerase sigma-70 factor, ECF subfamily